MKKLLTLFLILAIAGPAVACLCASEQMEAAPACAMDKPESCCCKTEVQTPPTQQFGDFLPSASCQLSADGAVAVTLLPQARYVPGGKSSPDFKTASTQYASRSLFLTLQSFLI